MRTQVRSGLARSRSMGLRGAIALSALALMLLHSPGAAAQDNARPQAAAGGDELEVTMHIIVDPNAKLPDEVVRRIPLPVRKSTEPSSAAAGNDRGAPTATDGRKRARETDRESAARAQERVEQGAEQREAAPPLHGPEVRARGRFID
jgi:hypothetical protein